MRRLQLKISAVLLNTLFEIFSKSIHLWMHVNLHTLHMYIGTHILVPIIVDVTVYTYYRIDAFQSPEEEHDVCECKETNIRQKFILEFLLKV
jgi:hypothetical protein